MWYTILAAFVDTVSQAGALADIDWWLAMRQGAKWAVFGGLAGAILWLVNRMNRPGKGK